MLLAPQNPHLTSPVKADPHPRRKRGLSRNEAGEAGKKWRGARHPDWGEGPDQRICFSKKVHIVSLALILSVTGPRIILTRKPERAPGQV
jgi:hypothetical protein